MRLNYLRYCLFFFTIIPSIFSIDHTISVSRQAISLAGRGFYVSSVVDSSLDGDELGSVKLTPFNLERSAVMGIEVGKEIYKYFGELTNPQDDFTPIIIVIDSLFISEETGQYSEIARATIGLSFFLGRENDQAHLFSTSASSKSSSYWDVTDHHPANIAIVLDECLVSFNNFLLQQQSEQQANSTSAP